MNVANAMAAAGAAFAAGAPLHDIRQGLRTFTTSYYLSPGRMNLLKVRNVDVVVDYCHNPAGMRALGDFVQRFATSKAETTDLAKPSRIAMIGAAGDRRDEDIRELGEAAADFFDVVVVREDANLRRRPLGETAKLVAEGLHARMAEGARCKQVEIVPDELEAVRHCMARANRGDLVVLCADKHAGVLAELESLGQQAQPGAHSGETVGDPDLDPEQLKTAAATSGDEAQRDLNA
jgi:cyanophycin synthetase